MGDTESYHKVAMFHRLGQGVEKDEEKELYHFEEAAIAGHPDARFRLVSYEWRNGRFERAAKHWIIAANLGHDNSIQVLKEFYKEGHVRRLCCGSSCTTSCRRCYKKPTEGDSSIG